MVLLLRIVISVVALNATSSHGVELHAANVIYRKYEHVNANTTIGQLLAHPAFAGFAQHLLARESDATRSDVALRDVHTFMPYHSAVNADVVVSSLNRMIDDVRGGRTIFYDFYNVQDRQADHSKTATGLFFFRGKPGAPFAVICPGGGFSYVGSFHEGFPYALELSKKGYNAFVLQYRVGGGGAAPATRDLAAALSFIFANADTLEVSTSGYSLWGSSAGARMVAYIGSHGAAPFGGNALPRPATIVMAYTAHSEYSPNDPPTFAVVGELDGISPPRAMQARIQKMRAIGLNVSLTIFSNVGHGFGLGVGTNAQGWIDEAIRFWALHIPN